MSRPGNPLEECFCHMGLEVLSNILLKSSVALLVIKEKIGSAWAIHLHILQIWKCRISLQDVEDDASIPRECGWVQMPGSSAIVTSSSKAYSLAGGWTTVTSYSRDVSTSDKPWMEKFCTPTLGTYFLGCQASTYHLHPLC